MPVYTCIISALRILLCPVCLLCLLTRTTWRPPASRIPQWPNASCTSRSRRRLLCARTRRDHRRPGRGRHGRHCPPSAAGRRLEHGGAKSGARGGARLRPRTRRRGDAMARTGPRGRAAQSVPRPRWRPGICAVVSSSEGSAALASMATSATLRQP